MFGNKFTPLSITTGLNPLILGTSGAVELEGFEEVDTLEELDELDELVFSWGELEGCICGCGIGAIVGMGPWKGGGNICPGGIIIIG